MVLLPLTGSIKDFQNEGDVEWPCGESRPVAGRLTCRWIGPLMLLPRSVVRSLADCRSGHTAGVSARLGRMAWTLHQ